MMIAGTEIEVVGEATGGHECVRLVDRVNPDVVMLDVRMEHGDGLQALAQIKQSHPDLHVMMFSTYDNPSYIARAVALGASGYVLKSASRQEFVSAIRTVAEGRDLWTRSELRRVTGALAAPRMGHDVDVPLTRREVEVLAKMADGLTNKEIADSLSISYETVKEHVQHILQKVGVSDRTQAAVWAVRHKVV